jgi:putative membrane protein
MKSPRPTLALAAALLIGSTGFAAAQQTPQDSQSTPSAGSTAATPGASQGSQAGGGSAAQLDRKDRKFIEKAAMDGMTEVELGRLAQSQGQSDQVKQFGAQMQQDHGKANAELMQIAQSKGVTLPAKADRKAQKKVKDLGEYSGAEFDSRYVSQMVKEHEKDLKLFQDRARNSKDPEIRAFAEKNAQVIAAHLDHVKQVSASLEASEPTADASKQRPTQDSTQDMPPASNTDGDRPRQ